MSTPFTIYKSTPDEQGRHEIVRRGRCPEGMLGKQVRGGESILVGQALCDIEHFIGHDPEGRKLVHRHPPEEIARRAPPGWVPPIDHLAAQLAAKGINPALAARHALRRRHHAAVMHEAGKTPAGFLEGGFVTDDKPVPVVEPLGSFSLLPAAPRTP